MFYEESVRVPLIISWKNHTSQGTCGRLVNTGVDLLPTMLDMAGIEAPETLKGRSLLPLSTGKPVKQWGDYVVVQNDMYQTVPVDGLRLNAQGRMVVTERYKMAVDVTGTARLLTDLQEDPLELDNLAGDGARAGLRSDLMGLLEDWKERTSDPFPEACDPAPSEPV